jgi:glycosyltransferase involved in cell wall biosynthesis
VLLSILVPLYNEEETVGVLLRRVLAVQLPEGIEREIVIVDDGSNDSSIDQAERVSAEHPGMVRLIRHPANRGKGAAIRTAIAEARGDIGIIQDADLEYDPGEYPRLIEPLLAGKADAVYGSRFALAGQRRVLYFWHALANHVLTTLCNMFADLNLTDMETCYKAFRMSLVKTIPLRSERFGIEPEITIKLAQREAAIYEMPISYHGRTYAEGKKIGLKDALQAFAVILRYGLSRDVYLDKGARILDALTRTPRFNRWMADVLRPYLGPRVLEIGAGIGNLSQHLSKGRELYIATDLDPEHIARLRTRFGHRPNFRICPCNLAEPSHFDALREQADTVVCLNVLEHISDDRAGLRNIFDVLLPGGTAIVLVPEGRRIYGTLDEVLGHCRRYSESELREKMASAGFDVKTVRHFNRVTRPGWIVNGRILKRRSFGTFQLWLFDRLVPLWRRIDSSLPWNPVSIIAIGVKPRT